MDYKKLDEMLTGRNKDSKKLANNTYALRRGGDIAVRLHETDILTFTPSGCVRVDTGGWKTQTTKDRINSYAPHGWRVFQSGGLWYWAHRNADYTANGDSKLFTDGDCIGADGSIAGAGTPGEEKRVKDLRKRIHKYAKLCASKLPLPKPGPRDCWFCHLSDEGGKSMGDAFNDKDHLLLHMEEGYAVPSLVLNALIDAGYGSTIWPAIIFGDKELCAKMDAASIVRRVVRAYLYRRLGLPAGGGRSTGFAVR